MSERLFGWTTWLSCFVGANAVAIYFLFLKSRFPEPIARVVGRLYWWPTIPSVIIGFGTGIRGPWWHKVDDFVFIGAAPFAFLGHVERLYQLGVRGIINMCDEYEGPVDEYKKRGMTQLHLPTVDHFEPSVESYKKAIKFIEECVANHQSVYIHCRGGHGRSAAIAFCWLMTSKKYTLSEAQHALSSIRKVRRTLWRQPNINTFVKLLRS